MEPVNSWRKQWMLWLALALLALPLLACSLPSAIERSVRAEENTPTPTGVRPTPGTVSTLPTVQLAPDAGAPGTSVTVSGQNWQPSGTVLLRFENPNTGEGQQAVFASVSVTDGGTFVALINIPRDLPWPGLDAVQIRAWSATTGESAVVLFRLTGTPATPETPPPTATPFPTETPLPAPLPTLTPWEPTPVVLTPPAPPPSNEPYGTVVGGDLNMRGGPGVNYPLVAVLPDGTTFVPIAQDPYGDWILIRLNGGLSGWVYRAYTDYTAALPVVVPPPPPTAVPVYPTATPPPTPTPVPVITSWRGEYYANPDLAGGPLVVRDDPAIAFDWGLGAPAPGLPVDNFSARWTRTLYFVDGGLYRFHARMDDGARLYVDGSLVINEWHDGSLRDITADYQLNPGNHSLRVEYFERFADAAIQVWWERVSSYPDWRGEYWANPDQAGQPVLVRNDQSINFDWGLGSPAAQVPSDYFSARWTRTQSFDAGTYRFHLLVDDGARVWIDDRLLMDEWHDGSLREVTQDLALVAGGHPLRVEYYERAGTARVQFWWERITPSYPDWKGEYWSNQNLAGAPALVRNDPAVYFDWGDGAPAPLLPTDHFSVRWTKWVDFAPGTYAFYARADDGYRLAIDNQTVIDQWHDGDGSQVYAANVGLAGPHLLTVTYYENGGGASVAMSWSPVILATATPTWTRVPPSATPTATRTNVPPSTTPTGTSTVVNELTPGSRPTATPGAAPSAAPTATPTNTPSPTPAPSQTPPAAATATQTAPVSSGPTATASLTPGRGSTPAGPVVITLPPPENTPLPTAASTPVPTATTPPTATATPVPPTATTAPTATSAATATATAAPSTATQAPPAPTALPTRTPPATATATPVAVITLIPTAVSLPTEAAPGGPTARAPLVITPLRPTATAAAPAAAPTRAPRGRPAATALRPTAAPVRRATATAAPLLPGIHLSEILANPLPTDWNADGWLEAADSWIELYNSGRTAVNLAGWTLVSSSITGTQTITQTYRLPAGAIVQPGAYLVIYSEESGLSLSPTGGRLQLRSARGALADQVRLPALPPGASYSRDRLGSWHDNWPPSPGSTNGQPRIITQDELTPAAPPPEPLPR